MCFVYLSAVLFFAFEDLVAVSTTDEGSPVRFRVFFVYFVVSEKPRSLEPLTHTKSHQSPGNDEHQTTRIRGKEIPRHPRDPRLTRQTKRPPDFAKGPFLLFTFYFFLFTYLSPIATYF